MTQNLIGIGLIIGVISGLFLAMSLIWQVIYQFIGRGVNVSVLLKDKQTGKILKNIETESGVSILNLVPQIPSSCGGKAICGMCKVKVDEIFGAPTATEKTLVESGQDQDGRFERLACQCSAANGSVFVNETDLLAKIYDAEVVNKIPLTSDKMEVWFQIPGKAGRITYKAGQFMQIQISPDEVEWYYWDNGKEIKKVIENAGKKYQEYDYTQERWVSYSLSSKPADGNLVKFIVRMAPSDPRHLPDVPCLGPKFVHELKVGSKVRLKGPFGDFYLRPGEHKGVGIAGGAGMAPLVSILETWFIDEQRKQQFTFFIGERRFQDLSPKYLEIWINWTFKYPNFVFVPVLSGAAKGDDPSVFNEGDIQAWNKLSPRTREALVERKWVDPKGEKWLHHTGFIPPIMKEYFDSNLDLVVYECGPSPMVLTCNNELISLCGIKRENTLFDDFFNTSTLPTMERKNSLLFRKTKIIQKFSESNFNPESIRDFEKKLDKIILFGLIFQDRLDEADDLLGKMENIIKPEWQSIEFLDKLCTLIGQYESKK